VIYHSKTYTTFTKSSRKSRRTTWSTSSMIHRLKTIKQLWWIFQRQRVNSSITNCSCWSSSYWKAATILLIHKLTLRVISNRVKMGNSNQCYPRSHRILNPRIQFEAYSPIRITKRPQSISNKKLKIMRIVKINNLSQSMKSQWVPMRTSYQFLNLLSPARNWRRMHNRKASLSINNQIIYLNIHQTNDQQQPTWKILELDSQYLRLLQIALAKHNLNHEALNLISLYFRIIWQMKGKRISKNICNLQTL